jgi:aspartate ammonia-lyase
VKLLVFVLEDGILVDQANYTSYYGGASTIVDFEHNGVLRYVATDIMGDTTTSTLGIHEQSFNVNLSSQGVQDPTKTGVLAMLVDDSGRVLYNAQYVISGQNQDFD